MKQNRINTNLFNFRLFLEALKRLRVIGLAAAILAVTASALVPAAVWINRSTYMRTMVYEAKVEELCVPAGLMVLMAPLFFSVLFSFLQKRRESDFFHAIPYTRTCVYVSFVTAALVFVWVIQLVCGLTAGILWSMLPRASVDYGGLIAYVAISMLAAAMLSSFMMLALTVSGTGGSCTLLFLLFACLTRVVCAIFLGCADTLFLVDGMHMAEVSFLSHRWFLPLNTLLYLLSAADSALLMYGLPNILYSVAVTLGMYALAGLLYNRRRSEMAGNPAPGVKTQALFRILFTSLPTLLIPLLVIAGEAEPALMLVLVVGILVIYFLYELITTKRPKNLLRIFPGLGIVAGICVAFFLSFTVYRSVTIHETITPKEVKWVTLSSNTFSGGSYQDCLVDTLRIKDEELIQIVTDRLDVSQQYERDGYRVGSSHLPDDYYNRMDVVIRLKNGRTLYRHVAITSDVRTELRQHFNALEEVQKIMYLLPDSSEIRRGSIEVGVVGSWNYFSVDDKSELKRLAEVFREEFEMLSEEQKNWVMGYNGDKYAYADLYKTITISLSLSGTVQGQGFGNSYIITEDLPQTREAILALWEVQVRENNRYHVGDVNVIGNLEGVLKKFEEDAKDPTFTKKFSSIKGAVILRALSPDAKSETTHETFLLDAEDYVRLIELLMSNRAVDPAVSQQTLVLTEDTYYLQMYRDSDNVYTSPSLNLCGVFRFTPEDLEELRQMLTGE